jgi:hypothetical protein
VTTVRQDGVNLVRVARADRGVPGFEPDQPVPVRPEVCVVVCLTCIFTTDVCYDVRLYADRL